MLRLRLGVKNGFAVNRYPEIEVWTKIVAEVLGVKYVQFASDLLNPYLTDDIVKKHIAKINAYCKKYGLAITSTFTHQFMRTNHLMHPYKEIREHYVKWFRRFFRISRELGAVSSGSHFGAMSMTDYLDKKRRRELTRIGIENWNRLSRYARRIGLKYLMFEPMSIPREMAETIKATERLYKEANKNSAVPILLCLDVDHGDVGSKNPADTDPYAWLETFGARSPEIHIKQSLKDKGGHWPFTPRYNRRGNIRPEKVIRALEKSGAEDVTLLLELSHRERYPAEYTVIEDHVESVKFWRRFIKD